MEELPSLLLLMPADMWGCILSYLCPKDVCVFATANSYAAKLAQRQRQGILLARHCSRVQLRSVKHKMQARSNFVLTACGLQQLYERDVCQSHILDALQVRVHSSLSVGR